MGGSEATGDQGATVETVWAWIVAACRGIDPDEFLFRSAAHLSDRRTGLSTLWLASNDGWKKRVTERLTIPRTDSLDTEIEFDVDIAQIRRHGLSADADGRYWLPLLASGYDIPSTMDVVDEHGASVPRATTSDVRWNLAAALASLLVRAEPEYQHDSHRRDVTLLLAAAFRRFLERRGPSPESSAMVTPEESWRIDPHSRRRTDDRIKVALDALDRANWPGKPGAERPDLTENMPRMARPVLELALVLASKRFLVVGADHTTNGRSFRCNVPSRGLAVKTPASIDNLTHRDTQEAGWVERQRISIRKRLYNRTKEEGPASGRAILTVDLLAFTSSQNYHVMLTMPDGTQARSPEVVIRWAEAAILDDVRTCVRRAEQAINTAMGHERSTPERRGADAVADRAVSDLSMACRDLRGYLRVILSDSGAHPEDDTDRRNVLALKVELDHLIEATANGWPSVERVSAGLGPIDAGAMVGTTRLRAAVAALAERLPAADGDKPFAGVEEGWAVRSYVPRVESHPDAVHVAVPTSDMLTRTIPIHDARLVTGMYLADPRPHTPTNLVNVLNTAMVAMLGIGLLIVDVLAALHPTWTPPDYEIGAVITILVLFVAIQAYRIERPGRVHLRGWLGRMPFLLGLLSPLPAVLLGIWIATGGIRLGTGWWSVLNLVVSLAIALALEVLLIAWGIHAGRESAYWDPLDAERRSDRRAVLDVLLPRSISATVYEWLNTWLGGRTRDKLHLDEETTTPSKDVALDDCLKRLDQPNPDDPRPADRLLGLTVRTLPFGSLWFIPRFETVRGEARATTKSDTTGAQRPSDEPVGQDVSRLLTREMQDLLSEAVSQNPVWRSQKSLVLWMRDDPGRLKGLMHDLQGVDPTDPHALPAVDISGMLGVSFAGYAVLHLIAGDPSAGLRIQQFYEREGVAKRGFDAIGSTDAPEPDPPLPASLARRRPAPLEWGVDRVDQDLEPDELPVRVSKEIIELLIEGEPGTLPEELDRLAGLAKDNQLFVMLCHFPTAPPPGHVTGREWLRVRIGVPYGHEDNLAEVLRGFVAARPSHLRCQVASVAEFARPTGASPTEKDPLLEYPDPSRDATGTVTFVTIQSGVRQGMVHTILTAMRETICDGAGVRRLHFDGCSMASIMGRVLVTFYFERPVAIDQIAAMKRALQESDDPSRIVDPLVQVRSMRGEAWPTGAPVQTDTHHPSLRLTWSAPNLPGAFLQLMTALAEQTELRPNLSYVFARVKDINSFNGRLVIRLEGVDDLSIGSEIIDRLVHDTIQRLNDHVASLMRDVGDGGHRGREVFVTGDVFRKTPDGELALPAGT